MPPYAAEEMSEAFQAAIDPNHPDWDADFALMVLEKHPDWFSPEQKMRISEACKASN
jgi:hypothetical protein